MIHQDGYYLGKSKQAEDAVGGNITRFTLSSAYWFVDNRHVLSLTIRNLYKTTQLSKEQFISRITINRYFIENNTLTIIKHYDTKLALEIKYIIVTDEEFKNIDDLFNYNKW